MCQGLEDLLKKSIENVKCKVKNSKGLFLFAKERAKFEGWLKVEICSALAELKEGIIITPEKEYKVDNKKNKIDIEIKYGENTALIELKIVSTNYVDKNTILKTRPITSQIKSIIGDSEKLRKIISNNKNMFGYVIFIAFPLRGVGKYREWKEHICKIEETVEIKLKEEFKFQDKIPGIIYFGKVKL